MNVGNNQIAGNPRWTDWVWQKENAVTDTEGLKRYINLSSNEIHEINSVIKTYKMKITPHLLSLIKDGGYESPIRRAFLPSLEELSYNTSNLFVDVNLDKSYSPIEGLVHRYPSKVLIFPTNYCGASCRYCFRRHSVNSIEKNLSMRKIEEIISYIEKDKNIEEVILSGGDPLVLDDEYLYNILDRVMSVSSVRFVRIHTRIPVSIPFRINDSFLAMLQSLKVKKNIHFVIHIDTQEELSIATLTAISLLVDNGFSCFASCPLLKGINDDENILKELWTKLVENRVKPYYLFHSDPVEGLLHFIVPISRGQQILNNLYDNMSGLAMPLYCLNVPNGGGHVLLGNNSVRFIKPGHYKITNFEGKAYNYYEPLTKSVAK